MERMLIRGCRYFNETGSNCPSVLPHDQQKALCDLAVAAAKALGFQMGVLHTELKYTSHGPQLIEVGPLETEDMYAMDLWLLETVFATEAAW